MTWSVTIAGLIADLVGVSFIAWSHFTSGSTVLRELASTKWNMNRELLASLSEARADSLLGFSFLFGGFVLQLAGATLPAPTTFVDVGFVIGVIVATVLTVGFRGRIARLIERRALKE